MLFAHALRSITGVGNVSTEAFRLVPPPASCHVYWLHPTAVRDHLRRGTSDFVLVPIACVPEFVDRYEAVGYGIAACESLVSVRLFSSVSTDAIAETDGGIYVSGASQSSRQLLRVLWRHRYGRDPILTPIPESAVACVLIGDEAVISHFSCTWPVSTDLCAWWSRATGLPFVFARWFVSRRLSPSATQVCLQWLEACCQAAASPAGQQLMVERARSRGLFPTSADGHDYFRRLMLRLDTRCVQAEQNFLREIDPAYA